MRNTPAPNLRQRRFTAAKRRRVLALETLERRVVLTQLQYGLFDTAVDAAGNLLPGASSDPHWLVSANPGEAPSVNAFVISATHPSWVPNGTANGWVSVAEYETPNSAGDYTYRTTFNVTDVGGGGQLTGQVTGDDNIVDVLINGVSTGYNRPAAYTGWIDLDVSGALVSGTNTIDVIVESQGDIWTGFQTRDLALNILPTVAVASPTVTVPSGSTATNTGSFGDIDLGDTVTITSDRGTVVQNGTNSGTFTFTEANVTAGGPVTITATDSNGGVQTVQFNIDLIPNSPPVLAGSGTPMTIRAGGPGVPVDPGLTVTDPDGPNLTTASVSIGANFTPAEDRLLFTPQNGITGSYNQATGILTLTGSASAAQYQAALRSVLYQNTDEASPNLAPRSISFSIAPGAYNPANGHIYEFVPASGVHWTDARAAALARSLFGLQGYLATLTSDDENQFAFSKAEAVGWIGASDAAVEGEWRWTDGPEAGQQFWQGLGTGSPVGGMYNAWSSGEPNDSGGEDYAHFLLSGFWNDYANDTVVQGYLVEYGGMPGDPVLQLTSMTNVNIVTVTDPPTVTGPPAPTTVGTSTYTITGTAEAGSLVQIYRDSNGDGVIGDGDEVVGSVQLEPGQTEYSVEVPLLPDVPNNFLATATASPSGESDPVAVPTVTYDATAPALPTVTGPAGPSSVDADATVVSGTAEAGSLVKIYADSNGDGLIGPGDEVVASLQLGPGQTTYAIAAPLTQDAANRLLVTATDAVGNESAPAVVPVVTEDSSAPVAPTLTAPAGPITVNGSTAMLTGTAEAGSLVKIYDDADGDGTLDPGETVAGFVQLAPGQTEYSVAVPLDPNAPNRFVVTASDMYGHESASVASPIIAQDSTPPSPPSQAGLVGPTSASGSTATIRGTAEAGSLVQIYRDSNGDGLIGPGDDVVGTLQLAPGQTDYSVEVPLLPNASNDFLVSSTDEAGNRSAPLRVPTIVQDSAPPAAPTLTGPTAPTSVNGSTATITGTAEAGSLVEIYADTNGDGVIGAGDALVGSLQLAPGQTSYSVTVPLAPGSANNFLVSSTDGAGNRSAVLRVPAITQDSVAPTVLAVQRFGYHAMPTYLVVTFSEPMGPARAQDPANYRIVDSRGRRIRVASVQYDAATNSATLAPAERLNLHWRYQLTVVGTGAGALTDAAGNPLDGRRSGQAGDFTATIDRTILAGRTPFTPLVRARANRPAPVHRGALDSLLGGLSRLAGPIAARHPRG